MVLPLTVQLVVTGAPPISSSKALPTGMVLLTWPLENEKLDPSAEKVMFKVGFMLQATFRLIIPTPSSLRTESNPSVDWQAQEPSKADMIRMW